MPKRLQGDNRNSHLLNNSSIKMILDSKTWKKICTIKMKLNLRRLEKFKLWSFPHGILKIFWFGGLEPTYSFRTSVFFQNMSNSLNKFDKNYIDSAENLFQTKSYRRFVATSCTLNLARRTDCRRGYRSTAASLNHFFWSWLCLVINIGHKEMQKSKYTVCHILY